jgi:hypothetical protein
MPKSTSFTCPSHDVLRADVAVHDVERLAVDASAAVRVREALERPHDELHRSFGLELLARLRRRARDRRQVLTGEVFHRDVVGARVLTEVEDLHDVGVRELNNDARLVEEHLDEGLV